MKNQDKTKEQLINEVVELHPGVLLVQLNGKRDSGSSQQLVEVLRERIVETNPSVAVVDVTHVPNIDTKMVQHLTNMISTVRPFDTQLIVAGVNPSMSQQLVHLGIDLSDITICHSLAAGLWIALDIVEPWTASKASKAKITKRDKGKTKEQSMNELIEIPQPVAK